MGKLTEFFAVALTMKMREKRQQNECNTRWACALVCVQRRRKSKRTLAKFNVVSNFCGFFFLFKCRVPNHLIKMKFIKKLKVKKIMNCYENTMYIFGADSRQICKKKKKWVKREWRVNRKGEKRNESTEQNE